MTEEEAGKRLSQVVSDPSYNVSSAYWSWKEGTEKFVNEVSKLPPRVGLMEEGGIALGCSLSSVQCVPGVQGRGAGLSVAMEVDNACVVVPPS